MLAFKALRGRGLRVPVAVLGVAASCVLVLVLRGAGLGVNRSIERYAGQPSVDLWVMPRGTESLLRASALLPAGADVLVEDVDGVADAAPLARGFARVERDGTHIGMLGVGYEVDSGMGGPPEWVEGRAPQSESSARSWHARNASGPPSLPVVTARRRLGCGLRSGRGRRCSRSSRWCRLVG